MSMPALLGLGGNIGDSRALLAEALRRLDALDHCRVLAVSRLFRTPPWGVTDQAWFTNACAAVETDLAAEALLEACLATERAMKRERIARWGPRTVDIDLLTYGDLRLDTPALTLPHPRMAERAFVLLPLADIAPGFILEGRSIAERAARTDAEGIAPLTETGDWWR
ncbi:2-amino-4-hydroxy-6-hydroxymethyldihydropteridine diphosphokinase [Rhizobium rhizosphaerae]|nr:2-amino-4-hydroxy-6-hydroxymethyldihydropteridine diphosphokinase [Xaviernesmea rhizosphaerae]